MSGRSGRSGRCGRVGARVAAVAIAATALGAGGAMLVPARAAVNGVEVGVWWRGQPDGGSLPAPPQVQADGPWISSDGTGPSAISAVRIAIEDGDSSPVLTLHVAQMTTAPATPAGTGSADVVACAVTGAWKPTTGGPPGAWSARPTYDCTKGRASGTLSADGQTLTFDLSGLAALAADGGSGPGSGDVEVALVPDLVNNPAPAPIGTPPAPVSVPAPAPTPPDPSSPTMAPTFDATFKPVSADDVAVESSPIAATAPASTSYGSDTSFYSSVMQTGSTGSAAAAFTPVAAPAEVPAASAPATLPPVVRFLPPSVARPVAAASKRSGVQVAFGAIFLAMCAWAWRLFTQDSLVAATGGRPFITLYDAPGHTERTAFRITSGSRVGKPPPLR